MDYITGATACSSPYCYNMPSNGKFTCEECMAERRADEEAVVKRNLAKQAKIKSKQGEQGHGPDKTAR